MPVPRTAFGSKVKPGLKTEFFATPDWTGRPVAVTKEPEVQADWENAMPAPEVETTNYSVRWSGALITAPLPVITSFRWSLVTVSLIRRRKRYRLLSTAK